MTFPSRRLNRRQQTDSRASKSTVRNQALRDLGGVNKVLLLVSQVIRSQRQPASSPKAQDPVSP